MSEENNSNQYLKVCNVCGTSNTFKNRFGCDVWFNDIKEQGKVLCRSCKNIQIFTGKKHTEETKKKISEAQKGEKGNMYGKHLSEETKTKISKILSIKMLGENNHRYGTHLNEDQKRKLSESLRKRNVNKVKDSMYDSIYYLVRKCYKYKEWRFNCMKRDNFTCKICGCNKSGKLQVNHKKPYVKILKEFNIDNVDKALNCEELWDINNGETVCVDCHKIITSNQWKNRELN